MINRITNQRNDCYGSLGLKIIMLSIVLLVAILPFASAGLIDNLMAYYKLDGNVVDSTGNNNGIDVGTINVSGKLASARKFSSAYIILDNGTGTLHDIISEPFSISLWAKLEEYNNNGFIGGVYSPSPPLNGWGFYQHNPSGALALGKLGVNELVGGTNLTTPLGTWQHLVMIYNSTYVTFYINGVQDSLGWQSYSSTFNSTNIFMGAFNSSGAFGTQMKGSIDEVGIWNKALTTAEVSSLYNSGLGNTYPLFERYRTFNPLVYSTSSETFLLNAELNYNTSLIAYLIYNGTSYSSSISGSSNITLTNTINVPSVSSATNVSFYWSFLIDGTTVLNTSSSTQTISPLSFGLCSPTLTVNFINITTRSAENPFPIVNATFKSSWDISTGLSGSSLSYTYEDVTEDNSTWRFCCSALNQSLYASAHFEYDATGYAQNSYYLTEALLTNQSQLISLYTLNDSKATVTVLKAIDNAQTPIEDVTISMQLYDVGTGTFYTVGMARTDFKGEDIAYLNWYDSLYRFVLVKDGTVLLSTNTTRISSTPVTFDITSATSFLFEKFLNFQYSLSFNNATNNFVLTFVKPSGLVEQGCLRVIKRTGRNDTEVCLTCESSSSATVYCNVNAYGNGTYIAHFYATGSFYDLDWIVQTIGATFSDTIYDLLGSSDASFYAFIFGGIVTFMFFIHPVFGVIGALLGILGASALGFAPINYLTFVGIALIGGVIIWIIKR